MDGFAGGVNEDVRYGWGEDITQHTPQHDEDVRDVVLCWCEVCYVNICVLCCVIVDVH